MRPPSRSPLLHRALALLACAATLPAQAGLSLDQALARHRQLLAADAGTRPGVTEALPPMPDGILLAGGNSTDGLPQLLASPLGADGSGLRLVHTLADGREGDEDERQDGGGRPVEGRAVGGVDDACEDVVPHERRRAEAVDLHLGEGLDLAEEGGTDVAAIRWNDRDLPASMAELGGN